MIAMNLQGPVPVVAQSLRPVRDHALSRRSQTDQIKRQPELQIANACGNDNLCRRRRKSFAIPSPSWSYIAVGGDSADVFSRAEIFPGLNDVFHDAFCVNDGPSHAKTPIRTRR
jgi:hypothetical protein